MQRRTTLIIVVSAVVATVAALVVAMQLAARDARIAQEMAMQKQADEIAAEERAAEARLAAEERAAAAAEEEAALKATFGYGVREAELKEDSAFLEEMNLYKVLFATKTGTTVTIYDMAPSGVGEPRLIFSYEEYGQAGGEGEEEVWQDMPPSVAVSPDGKTLAYSAADGLKVYDRQSARVNLLEKLVTASPVWSKDGSRIAVQLGPQEAGKDAVVTFPDAELLISMGAPEVPETRMWRPVLSQKPFTFYSADRQWSLSDSGHPVPTMALSVIGLDDVLFEVKDGVLTVVGPTAETSFKAALPQGYAEWTDLRLMPGNKLALSGVRYAEGNRSLQHYVVDLTTLSYAKVGAETPAAPRATIIGAVPPLE